VKPVVLVGALQVKNNFPRHSVKFWCDKGIDEHDVLQEHTHTHTQKCADKKEERGREMSKWLTFRLSVHEGG
jgi:hypothetical protein